MNKGIWPELCLEKKNYFIHYIKITEHSMWFTRSNNRFDEKTIIVGLLLRHIILFFLSAYINPYSDTSETYL